MNASAKQPAQPIHQLQRQAQPNRLAAPGLVDRTQVLSFLFDGRRYTGFGGDTLASALLGAGVKLVGRSFKYHRPRGILSAGSEEPNALVELRSGARREANTRATVAELFEGLEARSQNRWPSLGSTWARSIPCCRRFSWPASTIRPSCGRRPSGRSSTSR